MFEVFNYNNRQVEVIEIGEQVLFNANDVAKILEISSSSLRNHLSNMNDNQKIKITNEIIKNSGVLLTDSRKLNNFGETFLTEAGVYKLVFKSRKPEAEKFTDWIAEEVLPSIRKTGGYIKTSAEDDEKTIMARALLVAQATIEKNKEKIIALESEVEKQQDDVDFSNRLQGHNKKLYKMQEVAELLKLPYGNITLFRKLRENDILKVSNRPYQEHLNSGRFEVVIQEYFVNGSVKYTELTVATTKGIKWLHKNRYKFNLV